MKKLYFAVVCLTMFFMSAKGWDPPTMGWSSWNAFGHRINEGIIKSQADALVSSGLRDAGYMYVNIDDGAFAGRDSEGNLNIHPTRFPNGLKPVVEYIESLGLKAGTYSDAGYNTCASFWGGDVDGKGTGLYTHDQQDIDFLFKELGFKFIKVDFCGGAPEHNEDQLDLPERERYTAIGEAIAATGIPGLRYNVCRWAYPGTWVGDVATSWRISQDIYLGWASVKDIIRQSLYLSAYATEGRFNDMDMLEVGRGLTEEEDKTHFGMWCMLSSPLLIGCDLTEIDGRALALLTNGELIALNQDPLALQAYVAGQDNGAYTVVKDVESLNGKTRAVALYNPTDNPREMTIDFFDIDLGGKVAVRDLFEKKDMGEYSHTFTTEVPAHGTRIYRLVAEERYERYLYEAETAWITAYQELDNNQVVESGIYEENASCSGGAKVGWLGRRADNDLQWNNVHSFKGGDYTMTLSFISGADRAVTVEVNGEEVETVVCNSGGWDVVGSVKIPVALSPGNNTVRLYSATDWMPDIDCMTLVGKGSTDVYRHKLESIVAKGRGFDVSTLPQGLQDYLTETINANEGEKATEEEYLAAIGAIEEAIAGIQSSVEALKSCDELYRLTRGNADNSVDNDARKRLEQAMDAYNEALTKVATPSGLTDIYEALALANREFITSEDSEPLPGKTWDATILISNPRFDGDTGGWSGNPTWGCGAAEFWNKTFETRQMLTGLKNGYYAVGVNALYRTGSNDSGNAYRAGTEAIPALLLANEETVALKSLYSHPLAEHPSLAARLSGTDILNGYVNSMYGAALAFAENLYYNTVTSQVADGTLSIGLKSTTMNGDCWVCFDNFTLTYLGTDLSGVTELPSDIPPVVTVYGISGTMLYRDLPKEKISTLPRGLYIINGMKIRR